MPRLDDSTEHLLESGQHRAKRVWEDFTEFALRDNVLEVAVGLILAAAFTTVVSSFVSDILLPPIALLPFLNKNLDEKFAVLRQGSNATSSSSGYNTLQQALDDGAVIMAYGKFLDKCFNLLGISVTLFVVAKTYGWVSSDNIIKKQVRCRYCRKWISEKAKRCVNCTSWLDGREDK
ncbi:MAG: hypothetical protein MMC33_000658 [Icmadophila ericetorum]|nr:hypothetical protein [Icmadophila ericetorum]